jgi:LysM repeat protein
MRWRIVALASLGVNIMLTVVLLRGSGPGKAPASASQRPASAQTVITRTNVVFRREPFSWREVESPDYRTYIANLREIGCPDQTIRDIIIADVNSMFARRRATELVTPEQQWWRSVPDSNVVMQAMVQAKKLEQERRTLLTQLLGTNWESGDLMNLPRPTQPGIDLDGPVLGRLSPETKRAVEEITVESEQRMRAYLQQQGQHGGMADPAELAKLRQQTRNELAGVLSPGQLEEFLLRYSEDADNLREEFGQLGYFNPTPDEFRAVFRAVDSIDQQLQALSPIDPNSVAQRNALEAERETAIKNALGPSRYEEYQMLQDPLYRDAVASAIAAGTPGAAKTIYAINLAAQSTHQDISSDPSLTDSQKAIEQKQLDVDQLTANAIATGQQTPPPPAAPIPAPPQRTYVIHPGDSLAVLSMIFGLPPGAIRQANPNVNFFRLTPGDLINIPPMGLPPVGAP